MVINSTNQCYCLKCKCKKDIVNVQLKTNVKGYKYISANCKDCGCKVNKFIKQDEKLVPTVSDRSNNN
jgi:hypothetical protein